MVLYSKKIALYDYYYLVGKLYYFKEYNVRIQINGTPMCDNDFAANVGNAVGRTPRCYTQNNSLKILFQCHDANQASVFCGLIHLKPASVIDVCEIALKACKTALPLLVFCLIYLFFIPHFPPFRSVLICLGAHMILWPSNAHKWNKLSIMLLHFGF